MMPMCARFTRFHPWRDVLAMYRLLPTAEAGRNTEAQYNIAPTDDVLFVAADDGDAWKVREGRWWLVPWWAKELPRAPMFNARSEEADRKPAFRDALKEKRCLIPADGFYEWTKGEDGGRDPWFLHLPDTRPFSFAGLWAYNRALDVTSCTILTAAAVAPVTKVHDRMPVILEQSVYEAWLDPATPAAEAKALLSRNLDGDLLFHRVDRQVNSSKFEGGTELIASI